MVKKKTYKVGPYSITLTPTRNGFEAKLQAKGATITSYQSTAADAIIGAIDALE